MNPAAVGLVYQPSSFSWEKSAPLPRVPAWNLGLILGGLAPSLRPGMEFYDWVGMGHLPTTGTVGVRLGSSLPEPSGQSWILCSNGSLDQNMQCLRTAVCSGQSEFSAGLKAEMNAQHISGTLQFLLRILNLPSHQRHWQLEGQRQPVSRRLLFDYM